MENKELQRITAKDFFAKDNVKAKFQELLGKRASSFITSVLQIVASNDLLAKADVQSIYQSAAVSATLDLPLNNNLGFAYIVPYKNKQKDGTYKDVAQFQMGYKGFIQLAQRSGQFKTISASPIYEGQLIAENPLTGFEFDFTKKESDKIIGYAAYFKLLNGFEKTLYMTKDELTKHGVRFSQTFKKGFGLWKDDFDSMALKTVIKLLLSKFAPLSIEMQKAVITDQSVINNAEANDVQYVDNKEEYVDAELVSETKQIANIEQSVKSAQSISELEEISETLIANGIDLTAEQQSIFDNRTKELSNAK